METKIGFQNKSIVKKGTETIFKQDMLTTFDYKLIKTQNDRTCSALSMVVVSLSATPNLLKSQTMSHDFLYEKYGRSQVAEVAIFEGGCNVACP
jgi:hypothetical protein